ncbi:hypothetical protein LZ32DRAFT_696756 [Colletotrichum eremochloae]|nr:hypothetical protein LZ32DRAFT_696756 [Colletotrichum eremochloae]
MRYIPTALLTVGLLVGSAITAPIPDSATISPLPNGNPNGIPAHDKRSPLPDPDNATISPLPNGNPNGIPAHDKRSPVLNNSDPSSQSS